MSDTEKPGGLYPPPMTPTARQWVAAPVAATAVAPPPPPPGVHSDKKCDMSGQYPIVGWRYHKRGTDYDLCEAMWLTLPAHEQALFERIAPPPARAPELEHRLFAWRSVEGQATLRCGTATCGVMSALVFLFLCYPELRRNTLFLPATCEPYADNILRPEVHPYRHCFMSCLGCHHSFTTVPCSFKLGMHASINQYDLSAMWY